MITLISVPPSGGSLEIGNQPCGSQLQRRDTWSSPFGGIPRNWKRLHPGPLVGDDLEVPPSGGSLEIGNFHDEFPVFNCAGFPLRGDP